MDYMIQPPKKYTFEQPKLRKYIECNSKGKVLNLFAGKTRLNVNEIRVDLSDEFNPDYNMEAFDFVLYAKDNEIPIVIFGDMLATGSQCMNIGEDSLYRLNLPASLSVGKQEIKSLIRNYDLSTFKGFGCPLLYEVHRKFPHMRKFSIQRILRETRSGALEPGEALDLIWSFNKPK